MSGSTGKPSELSVQKRALLDLLIRQERAGAGTDQRIPRRTTSGPAPQSFAQQRLWMLEALQPGTSIFTVRAALRLTGLINDAVLSRSVNELVRRHESLRTTFTLHDGEAVQMVAPARDTDLGLIEVDGPTQPERDSAAWRRADEEAARPFDLEAGPLFRACLLRTGPENGVLLLTMHHIVADGWSLGILLRELSAIHSAYARGEPSPLPEPAIQYADYAVWQRKSAAAGALGDQLAYWTRQVAQLPPLDLPIARPRPAMPDLTGARERVILSRETTEALGALSHREGATLFMTLLAAWQVVLARLSGQDDFGIGTPIANRTRAEAEDVVGFFLNTLVMRADLRGDPSVRELLARVRETTIAAYANQDLPFERLLEAVRPPRDPSRTPLFQVFLNLLNFADERLNRPAALAESQPDHDYAQFDLTLYAGEHDHRLQLQLLYRTDLFDAVAARQMLEYLSTVLGHLGTDPDRRISALPLMPPAAQHELAGRRNLVRPDVAFEMFDPAAVEQSVPARFADQVRRYPHRIAVRTRQAEWTYHEVDLRVRHLAYAIRQAIPVDARPVAVICDHDAPMVIALLAVLRAGLAYVPMDPAHPIDRIIAMLDDAQAEMVVADRRNVATARLVAPQLPILVIEDLGLDDAREGAKLDPLPHPISPDAMAYVLYTSGSTGRPKGVLQNHRNVLHHVRAYTNSLHIRAEDRLSLLASYSFDAAVMDTYGALLNGATLCLYDVRRDGLLGLARWLSAERITIYHSTPTVYRQAFDHTPALSASSLRMVVLGGEEVRASDVKAFAESCPPGCLLVNGFGPTESTLALQHVLSRNTQVKGQTVPMGYPVEQTEVLVLNESGEDVDVYGVGRIVIESPHLALGYWRRPELTRAMFRPSPKDPGRRRYDTGDLGRRLPDGSIEFAGRRDRQLKIRGQRVEVGEIEALLVAHPAVEDALVIDIDFPTTGTALVAYVKYRPGRKATTDELRAHLRRVLPEHMVPVAVVALDALPLTVNGKADRTTLPMPNLSAPSPTPGIVPRTDLERGLAGLFATVLGRQQVSVTEDFFELGGHSLLATQLLSRVRSIYQVELPLRAIFEQPTVAGLSGVIEQHVPADIRSTPITALPREPPATIQNSPPLSTLGEAHADAEESRHQAR